MQRGVDIPLPFSAVVTRRRVLGAGTAVAAFLAACRASEQPKTPQYPFGKETDPLKEGVADIEYFLKFYVDPSYQKFWDGFFALPDPQKQSHFSAFPSPADLDSDVCRARILNLTWPKTINTPNGPSGVLPTLSTTVLQQYDSTGINCGPLKGVRLKTYVNKSGSVQELDNDDPKRDITEYILEYYKRDKRDLLSEQEIRGIIMKFLSNTAHKNELIQRLKPINLLVATGEGVPGDIQTTPESSAVMGYEGEYIANGTIYRVRMYTTGELQFEAILPNVQRTPQKR